jgi:Trk K+ transport system NAD-binding subunit
MANAAIDQKLKAHFGLKAGDDEGLRQALHVDFREVTVPYTGPVLHPPVPGLDVDPAWGFRRKWVTHNWGGYWEFTDFPLKDLDMEKAATWPMPSPDDFDYSVVPEQCKQWKDLALYVGNPGLGDMMNTTGFWCGMEMAYLSVGLKDPAWLLLIDRRLDIQLEMTERMLETAKGRIDFMWLGEDLGQQKGPLISLESYRELLRPRHQKFVDLAKAYNIPVVVVSEDEQLEEFARQHEISYYLQLDPAEENSLYLANVESAVGAIVATLDDYKNLAVTLTVKNVVNKNNIYPFFILALVKHPEFKDKLRLVGADYVETIPSIISKRVAILARKPPIFGEKSLLEEILFGEHTYIDIEELVVQPDSPVIGKTLRELDLRKRFGITVIAVKKADGRVIYTPGGEVKVEPLDILVVVAPVKQLKEAIRILFKGRIASRSAMLKKKIKERLDGLG